MEYNGILLSHKKDKIMPFAATQMDLEIVILSDVSQRQISYDITYMWNLKQGYKWTCQQNRNRVTDVENKLIVTEGKGEDWDWYRHTTIYSVQLLSCVWLFATPWTAALQASLSITNSQSLLKPRSIELVMPSNHLILCHPFSSCPQSFPASGSFQMSQLFASGGQSIVVSARRVYYQWTPRTDLL